MVPFSKCFVVSVSNIKRQIQLLRFESTTVTQIQSLTLIATCCLHQLVHRLSVGCLGFCFSSSFLQLYKHEI